MFQQLLRVFIQGARGHRECADYEVAINLGFGLASYLRNMDGVQQNLFLRSERYPKQNDTGISASLPDVALNRLGCACVILTLKDVSTFH